MNVQSVDTHNSPKVVAAQCPPTGEWIGDTQRSQTTKCKGPHVGGKFTFRFGSELSPDGLGGKGVVANWWTFGK